MRHHRSVIRLLAAPAVLVAAACGELPVQPSETEKRPAFTDMEELATAQLLVCPTQEEASAQAVIGPAGGSVGARGTSLVVPAGAVAEPTLFEVVVPVSRYMRVEIHAVGQDDYVFRAPVAISINYARCPVEAVPDEAALEGVYISNLTNQVLEVLGGTVDRTGHKITFSTGHLSGYAVAY